MEEFHNNEDRPVNHRRRPKSRTELFKEAYLPAIIAGVALLMIFIFIIGSIVRGVQHRKYEEQVSLAASASAAAEQARLESEATMLLKKAAAQAEQFNYDLAIEMLESFSGDMTQFSQLSSAHDKYLAEKEALVLWNDPSQVLNLSFQLLIAEPERAFTDSTYGTSYNRNFVTTSEFTKILMQLYENGYVLVRMSDITEGTSARELYLPKGKKPLMITQTNVNYNTYMVDGDGDKLPDKDGDGFASKLVIDPNGNLTCEMVDSTGQTVTGSFDLVPILNAFVETHPDFSYRGARAILAVTGYDGLFGYRTSATARTYFGEAYYQEQVEGAEEVIQALRAEGYELACYTYENIEYGDYSNDRIKADLDKWNAEVAPILGVVDMLVFARNSDISANTSAYSGEKFNTLKGYDFTYFLGFCTEGTPWFTSMSDHVRQGRILVTGSNLAHNAQWFDGILDPASVLDSTRGTIPQ